MSNFMLSNDEIWKIADEAEQKVSKTSSRDAHQGIIENAIRKALIAQAQQLITVQMVIPAVVGHGVLDLSKK